MLRSSVIWRDDYGFITRNYLFIMLKREEQLPDDVVDALVLMLHEELLLDPHTHRRCVIITWLFPIAMWKL